MLSFISGLLFQPLSPERERDGQNQVAREEDQVALEIAVREPSHVLGTPGKFIDGYHRKQGRVLDQINQLSGQRRKNQPNRLGKDDVAIDLASGQPDSARRFELRNTNTFDPATDD